MPEGHTIHRAARDQRKRLAGRPVAVSSPQGRFSAQAAVLDGRVLRGIDAVGKHLFYDWGDGLWVHVHLGLFGRFRYHVGDPPPPRDTTRLRMTSGDDTVDLSGATICALIDEGAREAILARLGPDPLRGDDPTPFLERVARTPAPVAAVLMDQSAIAGIGNVYRCEALYVNGLYPFTPGRALTPDQARALWDTCAAFLAVGVRTGRTLTVDPVEFGTTRSRLGARRKNYVYRRQTCLRCGAPVRSEPFRGRTLHWCPACQPAP